MQMYYRLCTDLDNLGLKMDGWDKQIRIPKVIYEVAHQIWCRNWRNSFNSSIIQDAEKDIATESIKKRTDAFVSVRLDAIPAPLELDSHVFADSQYLFYIFYHIHTQ